MRFGLSEAYRPSQDLFKNLSLTIHAPRITSSIPKHPLFFILFPDLLIAGFSNDVVKTNAIQILKQHGIDKGIEKKEQLIAFAETQRLQNELNTIVTKIFIEEGLPAIPYQASSNAIMKKSTMAI